MPPDHKLLRPKKAAAAGPSYDSDAATYIAAVELADGQSLETAVANAINDFVVGCKADGIWSAIKACCILCGARTLDGALTPLVGSAPTNNGPFVSGDYNRGGATPGLKGNGSTKYLNTNRNNNADPTNSVHQAIYASVINTGVMWYMGAGAGNAGATHFYSQSANAFEHRNRHLSSITAGTSAVGFMGTARSAAATYTTRANGTTTTNTQFSQTPYDGNVGVWLAGGNNSSHGDARIAFYSLGESLTLATLDTRVSALVTAIGAAVS